MTKFVFKLDPILKIREFAEHEAELELGRATSELAAMERDIAEHERSAEEARAARFSPAHTFADVTVYDLYISRLGVEKERLLRDKARQEVVVEEKRVIWSEAAAERKSLAELKSYERTKWRKAYNKEEELALEELHRSL
jgi:flagellar FliJ protein